MKVDGTQVVRSEVRSISDKVRGDDINITT